MPTAPTVIPLIVAGLMLGSMLVTQKRTVTRKKLLGASLLAGLLNAANAYAVYLLFPSTTSRFGGGNFGGGNFGGGFGGGTGSGASSFCSANPGVCTGGRGALGATSVGSFVLLSFITGLLIVIVVVGVALLYVRYKTPKTEEEEKEPEIGEEGQQEELEEPKQEGQEEI
ncbi:MAG TPA: hypothetical protein VEI80_00685 [Candidatus Acidoferrales bacterium]|nr:hypothetical protein [Candidatus Acidoferrales bacterium]